MTSQTYSMGKIILGNYTRNSHYMYRLGGIANTSSNTRFCISYTTPPVTHNPYSVQPGRMTPLHSRMTPLHSRMTPLHSRMTPLIHMTGHMALPAYLPGLGVTQANWGQLNQYNLGWVWPNSIWIQFKLGWSKCKFSANQVQLAYRKPNLNLDGCATNVFVIIGGIFGDANPHDMHQWIKAWLTH
jgi:hypothetical protein